MTSAERAAGPTGACLLELGESGPEERAVVDSAARLLAPMIEAFMEVPLARVLPEGEIFWQAPVA